MDASNPYEAPEAESIINTSENDGFAHLNFKQLQKLFYRSHNVSSIAGLIILGALFIVAAGYTSMTDGNSRAGVVTIGISSVCIITAIGLIKRTSWGRIMGIILCILMLFSFSIVVFIGLAGLFAFFKAPELFGENRVLHKDLKAEVKYRKQNKLTK